MLGFVMTRKMTTETSALYWKECHRCIRLHHPDAFIMIIDDHSDPAILARDITPPLYKTIIIPSEWEPGVGEILAFYYYHRHGKSLFSRAVMLHDSVFLQAPIPEDGKRVCFLWHFDEHYWDDNALEVRLIQQMRTDPPDRIEDLLFFYFEKTKWIGCFGVQCVIDSSYLDTIVQKYNIFNMIPFLHTRQDRSCLERVMGCLFVYENPEMMREFPSIGGSILQSVGGNFSYYWNEYQDDLQQNRITKKIIKVWTGR